MINYLALFVAAVVCFIVSTIWYIAFGAERARLLGEKPESAKEVRRPQPVKILSELVRNLILVYVIAYLLSHLDISGLWNAIGLGLLLWLGFPAILLSGSVMWDKVPVKLAAIHAGDWLLKLLIMVKILELWR